MFQPKPKFLRRLTPTERRRISPRRRNTFAPQLQVNVASSAVPTEPELENDHQLVAHLNNECTEAKITFKERYTACEIEALIFDLTEVRSKMTPAVPHDPPDPDTTSDAELLNSFDGADITIGDHGNGQLSLLIRHPGTGWLLFALDDLDPGLTEKLRALIPREGSAFLQSDAVDEERSSGTTHCGSLIGAIGK